jgi:DNA repair ATPase RecN
MLSHIEIRNFQSLHHVSLDLLPLTVIVGPSSSGKSAFTRALKLLTSNQRGHAFITHGQKISTVKAVTENGTVALKRGKGTDDNEYVVIPAEGEQVTYTKLSGTVPPEVSRFIGIESKDPINYAGQFDTPYLLRDGAGDVARTLGALTNVSVIFEGARESNRRKLASSSTLKTRAADLAAINVRVDTYKPLKAQLAAIEEAEQALTRASTLDSQTIKLRHTIETLEIAESGLARLEQAAALPVPSEDGIVAAAERLKAFRATLALLKSAGAEYKQATQQVTEAEQLTTDLETKYTVTLNAAGQCPTCGQNTKHLEHT